MSEENYIAATKTAMSKAYVPYSNYPVGVLIVTDNGNTYTGCNVENASYPLGNCAEASAIASMVMGGEKKIKHIYVMTKNDEGGIPCGGCRQRIAVSSYLKIFDTLPAATGTRQMLHRAVGDHTR